MCLRVKVNLESNNFKFVYIAEPSSTGSSGLPRQCISLKARKQNCTFSNCWAAAATRLSETVNTRGFGGLAGVCKAAKGLGS